MRRTPSSRSASPCGNISHVTFLGFATRTFPQGTHTVADAAAAVGVSPEQIVKSLVLRRESGAGVLVAVSGTNRLDLAKVAGRRTRSSRSRRPSS